MARQKSQQQRKIEQLQSRLQELEETLEAIRSGGVDAIVSSGPGGSQVYTIEGADHAYKVMVESMSEGAVTVTTDGTILYSNSSFAKMSGASPAEIAGRRFHDFLSAADHPLLNAILNNGDSDCAGVEIRLQCGLGVDIPVQISPSSIVLRNAKALTFIITDLTTQKRYEEIVSAERLSRRILDQAQEGIAVCIDGCIVRANQALSQICGSLPLMMPFDDLLPLTLPGSEHFSIAIPQSGETIVSKEVRYVRPDGMGFDLILNAGPLVGSRGEVLGCLVSLLDITDRKHIEDRLRANEEALLLANESLEQRVRERTKDLQDLMKQLEESRDHLRKLASDLVLAEEKERKRIATVLHDDVCQTLAVTKMRIDLLQNITTDDQSLQVIKDAREYLGLSIQEARSLMNDIGNPLLFNMGVGAACSSLAERFMARYPIQIRCDVRNSLDDVDPDLKIMVFQAIRELLNNAVKHSGARTAQVEIRMDDGLIRVNVTDDGGGFDPVRLEAPTEKGGYGLYSIQERLTAFNGSLQIDSAPGSGTSATLRLPSKLVK